MSVLIRIPPYERLEDPTAKECFQWIIDYIRAVPLLQGNFSHFEMEFQKAETELLIPHNLGFQPLDAWVTYSVGAGVLSFVYDKFTSKNLCVSTTGAVSVRFFAGRYE